MKNLYTRRLGPAAGPWLPSPFFSFFSAASFCSWWGQEWGGQSFWVFLFSVAGTQVQTKSLCNSFTFAKQ